MGAFAFGGLSFFLYINLRKLQAKTAEIDNFNELRKAFIDADHRLIYLKDDKRRYVFLNQAMLSFLDKQPEQIIGQVDHSLIDMEFAVQQEETDKEVLQRLDVLVSEMTWRDRVYQAIKFPIKLLSGAYGVGAYIEDITEAYRKRSEQEKVTMQLEQANSLLAEHKDKLQLILDSTAEAIYGLDLVGNCTFCNASCIRILGYQHQNELIGTNMHELIHHSLADGTPQPISKCRIYQAFQTGQGTRVEDEVFWRADGSSFPVEYHSYPQLRNGQVIGAVVTFMDITERKRAQEQIEYLSYHDSLTGLYNRAFFEQELLRLDTERNLPLSIIVGDVSGLKLTNDVFGHAAGDALLKSVAEVLRRVCRVDDTIARIGGDEFVVILPRTNLEATQAIVTRIQDEFGREPLISIKADISLGCGCKELLTEDIMSVLETAENKMYLDKALRRTGSNAATIMTIVSTLHMNRPEEKTHAESVRALSLQLGEWLGLAEEEIRRLRDASYLHDIGKIVRLGQGSSPNEEASEELERRHPVVGYRILHAFADTVDLAETVLSHHERWDGSGYPKGLKGEEIPKLARIIAIADNFLRFKCDAISDEGALKAIKKLAGKKFDPEMVQVFEQMLLRFFWP